MEMEVQFRIHKDFPLIFILSQSNPIPSADAYFFKIHSNIFLPSNPRRLTVLLGNWSPEQNSSGREFKL